MSVQSSPRSLYKSIISISSPDGNRVWGLPAPSKIHYHFLGFSSVELEVVLYCTTWWSPPPNLYSFSSLSLIHTSMEETSENFWRWHLPELKLKLDVHSCTHYRGSLKSKPPSHGLPSRLRASSQAVRVWGCWTMQEIFQGSGTFFSLKDRMNKCWIKLFSCYQDLLSIWIRFKTFTVILNCVRQRVCLCFVD